MPYSKMTDKLIVSKENVFLECLQLSQGTSTFFTLKTSYCSLLRTSVELFVPLFSAPILIQAFKFTCFELKLAC